MLDQHRINIMVWVAHETGDAEAIEALWEFYQPIFIEMIEEKAAQWDIEDRKGDMMHDCYVLFRAALSEYDFETYCFSYYLLNRMKEGLSGVIRENYLPE